MTTRRLSSATLTSLLLLLPLSCEAQPKPGSSPLAGTTYSDPDGYFKILPPKGWRRQTYPQDPRGKVAFIGPDGVELRILAKGLDYDTFEAMVQEIEAIEGKLGTNTNIERTTFCGQKAVKRAFTFKGVTILFIDFMIGNTTHNLMFSGPPPKFKQHLSLARRSMATYEPALRGVSAEDVKKHQVAKALRLGELFSNRRRYKLALNFIEQGLRVDPGNAKLLEMKKTITDKQ